MMNGECTPAEDHCVTCYACNERCPQGANPFDLIAALQEKYAVVAKAGIDAQEARYASEFVERLARTGAKEVVCFHDDCYAMLAKLAPQYGIQVPFRPVHLSEYLVSYLKAQTNRVKALDMKVAYQRPCASRHTPEKEPFIDELFQLTGVKRVAREFDRENALCCAGVKFLMGQGDPSPDQEKNVLDAKRAGAQAMVALCPMCMHSLAGVAAKHQLPVFFIGDLARMALGEIEKPSFPSEPSSKTGGEIP